MFFIFLKILSHRILMLQADLLETDKSELRDKLSAQQQAESWGKRTLVRPTGSIGADIASLTSPKPRTPVATRTPATPATTPATAATAATPVTATRTPLTSDKRALQKTVEQARELRDLQAQLQVSVAAREFCICQG
jgi:hypothetical protein